MVGMRPGDLAKAPVARHSGRMEAMSAEGDRELQLLAAAETLIRQGRSLNLSLGEVADRVGVSRSLLYVYFDGVPAIVDALFNRHLDWLEERVLPAPGGEASEYQDRALEAFDAYLDYLLEHGPILQLILRERHQDSPLGPTSRARFRSLLRRIARETSQALAIAPREAFVLLELVAGIPESLAPLVRLDQIDRDTAHATSRRLVAASLDAFKVKAG